MDENHYWIEQLCYDGTWLRLSDLYDEEMTTRAAWSSAIWLHPTQTFRVIKETRVVLQLLGNDND